MKFNIERIPNIQELLRVLGVGLKRLTFRENMEGQIIEVSGQGEISIPHRLTFRPEFYIILDKTGPGDIYRGQSQWTSDRIYLNSEQENTFTVWIGR